MPKPWDIQPEVKTRLLKAARQSIAFGLIHAQPPSPDLKEALVELSRPGASFVTLKIKRELRGCVGRLEATRPLLEDVMENAFAAAFSDSRFSKLSPREFSQIHISISVLSVPEPIRCSSEKDLLKKIQPGKDGLILKDKFHRATFLPSVWETLDTAESFLEQLKRKAGLPGNYWAKTIRILRYRTIEFSETDAV